MRKYKRISNKADLWVIKNTNMSFATIVKVPAVNEAYRTSASKSNKRYGSLVNPFVSYFSALGYLIDNNYAEALVDFRNLYRIEPEQSTGSERLCQRCQSYRQ